MIPESSVEACKWMRAVHFGFGVRLPIPFILDQSDLHPRAAVSQKTEGGFNALSLGYTDPQAAVLRHASHIRRSKDSEIEFLNVLPPVGRQHRAMPPQSALLVTPKLDGVSSDPIYCCIQIRAYGHGQLLLTGAHRTPFLCTSRTAGIRGHTFAIWY